MSRDDADGFYKVEVQADRSGTWCGNGLRFSTPKQARDYARDLEMRWTAVRAWRVMQYCAPDERRPEGWWVELTTEGCSSEPHDPLAIGSSLGGPDNTTPHLHSPRHGPPRDGDNR